MTIFNRYGQKIFSTENVLKGWDGTYRGEKQEQGSYIYIIRYKTGNGQPHEEKGSFLLLR